MPQYLVSLGHPQAQIIDEIIIFALLQHIPGPFTNRHIYSCMCIHYVFMIRIYDLFMVRYVVGGLTVNMASSRIGMDELSAVQTHVVARSCHILFHVKL